MESDGRRISWQSQRRLRPFPESGYSGTRRKDAREKGGLLYVLEFVCFFFPACVHLTKVDYKEAQDRWWGLGEALTLERDTSFASLGNRGWAMPTGRLSE